MSTVVVRQRGIDNAASQHFGDHMVLLSFGATEKRRKDRILVKKLVFGRERGPT